MATRRFGARPTQDVDNMAGTAAPVAATDDITLGYVVGSLFIDITGDAAYICVDNTDGAAVWLNIGAGVAAHAILDGVVHSDSVADGVTAGSIIIGNDTPKWDELVISIPGAANLLNVLGVVTGTTLPSWKVLFDATVPSAIGAASAGTGVVAARVNHVHAFASLGDYTVANAAADRSFDADTTTIDELADVLGTLITDLITGGLLT